MNDVTVKLNAEEAGLLLRLVGTALGDTRVEVHRTHHTPAFRDDVKKEEDLLRTILAKLQQ
jgi:hypothetical protein